MRKFTCFTLGLLLACAVTVNAQEQKNDQEGYKFTDIKRLPTTSVKSVSYTHLRAHETL